MTFQGVEVWRGGVKSEQIDEMGHLNVRFYVAIATEALASFAAELGMPGAFSAEANATLLVREHYIRFLQEARVRDAIHVTAGVIEMGETDARLLFVLWHSLTGKPCAAYTIIVAHVTARDLRPFPWPRTARDRAEALKVEIPDFAKNRSVPLDPVVTGASLEKADALGLLHLSAGAFRAGDCDVFGRMEAEHFMGQIVSGIPQFGLKFRKTVVEHTDPQPTRVGNAALEHRLVYLDWPRAGDRFVMRSGAMKVDGRGEHLFHWLLDPETGKPWGVCRAYIITFDLEARKVMPVTEAAQAALNADAFPGLTL